MRLHIIFRLVLYQKGFHVATNLPLQLETHSFRSTDPLVVLFHSGGYHCKQQARFLSEPIGTWAWIVVPSILIGQPNGLESNLQISFLPRLPSQPIFSTTRKWELFLARSTDPLAFQNWIIFHSSHLVICPSLSARSQGTESASISTCGYSLDTDRNKWQRNKRLSGKCTPSAFSKGATE